MKNNRFLSARMFTIDLIPNEENGRIKIEAEWVHRISQVSLIKFSFKMGEALGKTGV